MNLPPSLRAHRAAGFTLVEVLFALAIGAVVLGQILMATVSLERSFASADYLMNAQNDQLRALDYLSRDLHMASAVSVQNGGTAVALAVPNAASTSVLNLNLGPLLNALTARAGTPSNAGTVSYYLLGGQLIRETNGTQTVLANTVADLEFTQQGNVMTIDLLFTPQFSNSPELAAQQNTRASSSVYLRNLVTAN